MNLMPTTLLTVELELSGKPRSVKVGRLAWRSRRIYFEYDADFITAAYPLSPFHLPLKPGIQTGELGLFDGLPGVFNDSLPDGWGRLLLDRQLRRQGIEPGYLTPLDRLAYVGHRGMGALIYQPEHELMSQATSIELDRLAEQARQVLSGAADEVITTLLTLNGSSSGARPKALIGLDATRTTLVHGIDLLPADFTYWLVKFPAMLDPDDIGAIEYAYALMAKQAGIEMMPVHLFPAQTGAGYFATQRFDRNANGRAHVHSACGLLHADFRLPSLDYKDLLMATQALTQDQREVEKLYRLAVFNVLAHNQDDHSKNFSFLMDMDGNWRVTPAYDLTFSNGPGGEHCTTVLGEGKSISQQQLIELAGIVSIKPRQAADIIEQVVNAINQWPILADAASVSHASKQRIRRLLNTS